MAFGIGKNKKNIVIKIGSVTLELHEGNIANLDVDAIVNAANEHLILGSGVAAAIQQKGGDAIQEECYEIGHCEVGSAVMTGAGQLKARHVIHAVGPLFGEGDERNKLRSAIHSAIMLAEENKLTSIALPAIGTGNFHFPIDACAAITLSEIISLAKSDTLKNLTHIIICLYTNNDFEVFEKLVVGM